MKNMKKILTMMLMMASVLFFACSDDDDETLSPDEAKTEIDQVSTDMSTYMNEMENSDGMAALNALMTKPNPFAVGKSSDYSNSEVFKNIQKYLLPANYMELKSNEKAIAENSFDFNDWVGTYTWNATDENWDIQSNTPPDKIIIEYPTEGSQTNNATLTIHTYEDVEITETDDYGTYTWYQPTNIVADIYVNDIKVVDISMNANWITSGETAGEPTSMDVSVYLTPFEFTVDFSHSGNNASVGASIIFDNSQLFSTGLSAFFEVPEMDDTPLTINGYLQFLNVRFNVSINAKTIEEILEGMEEEPYPYNTPEELIAALNQEFDANVSVDGVKAADIELAIIENTQTIDIVFVYSDGSTESAQPYFSSFIADVNAFLTSLENYYSNW
ncbi:MAG: hypothetical protein PWP52_2046 [Bacteroidales bacterium]|nr:hypothetical protein [Bacteroidales bacterium]